MLVEIWNHEKITQSFSLNQPSNIQMDRGVNPYEKSCDFYKLFGVHSYEILKKLF